MGKIPQSEVGKICLVGLRASVPEMGFTCALFAHHIARSQVTGLSVRRWSGVVPRMSACRTGIPIYYLA